MNEIELDRVLEMAIAQEVAAHRMYTELAIQAKQDETRDALEYLAAEEEGHRSFLEAYRRGAVLPGSLALHRAMDAHVVEAFGTPSWKPDCKPEEAFLLAAKQEQVAHEFYTKLAEAHPEGEVRDLLKKLAEQELAHKEKVEYLYTNTAFPQTDGG